MEKDISLDFQCLKIDTVMEYGQLLVEGLSMNLTYAELFLTLALLLSRYDSELCKTTAE